LEVGDRDRCMEDADGDIVPGMFSFGPHPVCGACRGKLYQERSACRTTEAIVLWKSATETAAWKTLTAISCRVCFPSARIRFVGPAGDDGPGSTFSPALFYIGDMPERFEKAFAGIGAVWVVPSL